MTTPTKVHCFFEQSGTFKNEFRKLGIPAERAPSQTTEQVFGRAAIDEEVEAGGRDVCWCNACDAADCAWHGVDCFAVCNEFHCNQSEVRK